MANHRIFCQSLLLGLLIALSLPFGVAAEMELDDKQAGFLLKALSYDRNAARRYGDDVHLLIVYDGAENKDDAGQIGDIFRKNGSGGVSGKPLKVEQESFTTVAKLLKKIDDEGVDVVYIHHSLQRAMSSVQQVTRSRKKLSLCGSKEMVERGTSLGVYLYNGNPKVAVNLRAAKVEG
ncbi:MAG: YfiR/HmsC family protein, partial [Verrucomicrobiota bacterium]